MKTPKATRLGRGTPSFFINGKPFHGAQPYENLKRWCRTKSSARKRQDPGGDVA